MTQAYCVKCRKKVEMKGEKLTTIKGGRKALVGTCPRCGTKTVRFVKK